ncbi:MAG: ATP-binding protein [Treponemataceae bacterium]
MNELREARAVLDRLEEGLCTVDTELRLRAGWNAAFERIFGAADFVGKSIIDVAFFALSESQKNEVREALEVALLSGTSSDEMVDALLPFREFEHQRYDGLNLRKYRLSLSVDRLIAEGRIDSILIRFIDKTVTFEETKKEKEARAEMEDQYARIQQLFKNDRASVSCFFEDLKLGGADLADRLRALKQDEVNTAPIDESVAIVHSIKSEALSLGFETTAKIARALESALKERRLMVLDMEANLDLIALFERLNNESRVFARIMEKLSGFLYGDAEATLETLVARINELLEAFQSSGYKSDALESVVSEAAAAAGKAASRDAGAMERFLVMACQRVAQKERKLVRVVFHSDVGKFKPLVARYLKDALLHLVRNSVAHGIEMPAHRVEAGKSATGNLTISILREGSGFRVDYSDDGRGLDLPSIRAKAVQMGVLTETHAEALDERETARLVFHEGLSTRAAYGDTAGLGFGMSAVANIVLKRLKGKLAMTHRGEKGLSLRITVPSE